MTYTVLIVEDMKIIRQGISELLADFGSFDIFEASNGFEAVEVINLQKIDFMLVDIRMPYCSGLELLEILQEKKLTIPAIIISGFDDFHYAQKAMSFGVVGYLLKPIEETQFHREVGKIVNQLDEERQNQKRIANYEIVQKNWQTKERERVLISQLFSEEKRYQKSTFYTVSLLKIYSNDSFSVKQVKQLWEQNINDFFPLIVVHPILKDTYLFIFENDSDYYAEICAVVKKYIESLTNLLDIKFAMSVSQTNHFLCREVYEQVDTSLYQRLFYEESQLYFYQNYSNEDELTTKGNIRMLKKYLALNEWTKVKEMLDILLVYPSSQLNPKKYFFQLMIAIQGVAMETLGEEVSKQLSPLKVNHEFLFQYYNKTEIIDAILGLLQSVVPVEEQKITSQDMLVTNVKQYVLTHYSEDLTVKWLADLFNTNYSHLSTIFKKEEKISLGNYIKKVRMEEAQRLLLGTGNSITTIAEVVGFQDVQYFYKVFKTYTGLTPLNYRNQKV